MSEYPPHQHDQRSGSQSRSRPSRRWPNYQVPNSPRARRERAAELIEQVLSEEITATHALANWPSPWHEDSQDESLDAAYHLLWHFDCDEDWQQSEPLYLDMQLMQLYKVARAFRQGQDLPEPILASVRQEAKGLVKPPRYFSERQFWRWPVQQCLKAWTQFKAWALPTKR